MESSQVDYQVTVHHEDGSFWAEVVQLPGCFAAGDTMDELWESLRDSIGAYLSTPTSGIKVEIANHEVTSTSESVETRVLVC